MPGEIALIPFVESSFDPTARSHRGAAGLWQFMPGTGDALGLRRVRGYDGRLDVVASTRAALDYIELQADQWYEGDLELSLAAYNAGAGTVNRARRNAVSSGNGDDYWSLNLPRETMNYLPKLKAIAAIVDNPDKYQVALPVIEDAPAFAKIPVNRPLGLDEAARLSGASRDELAALNPALSNGTAHPGQARVLLVPTDRADTLMARLETPASSPSPAGSDETRYVVQSGDSLSAIASRQGVSVSQIRQVNGLNGDMLQPGQVLDLPRQSLAYR
ncbi:MAG: transglycosylase SLT domain-containing protein [Halomonas sp.]|nr:transglycosylase SLT domain-containing protein [Halomonas sp.]